MTNQYKRMKNEFLKRCNWRTFVESAIGRLERKMETEPVPPGRKVWIFKEDTYEECAVYARVSCVCAINTRTGERAPCWLFFPGEYNGIPLPGDIISKQLALALDELGWKQ